MGAARLGGPDAGRGAAAMSTPSSQAAGDRPRRPALVLTTCILASSLSFVDGSVVNVALPHIAGSMGRSLAGVQWVVDAYLLPLSGLLLLGGPAAGALAGRIGPRPLLTAGPLLSALGLALLLLTGGYEAHYATTVLPGLTGLAVGMALTAAPLTTAVLGSTPPHRAGAASGMNSALARTGGLIGTALLGRVLGAEPGPALVNAFHAATLVAAIACALGAVAAFTLLEGGPVQAGRTG